MEKYPDVIGEISDFGVSVPEDLTMRCLDCNKQMISPEQQNSFDRDKKHWIDNLITRGYEPVSDFNVEYRSGWGTEITIRARKVR